MNKEDYLKKKSQPGRGPYAGGICGKCDQGMNHKQDRTPRFSDEKERIIKMKYGSLCDDCRAKLHSNMQP